MNGVADHRKHNERNVPPPGGIAFRRTGALFLIAVVAAGCLSFAGLPDHPALLAQTAPRSDDPDVLVREVVTLDSEIGDLDGRAAELEAKSEQLGERIERIDSQVAENRDRLAARRAALSARARSIYMNGRSNSLLLLFTSNDFSDFLDAREMLKKVSRSDAALVRETKEQAEQLASCLADLRAQKKEVDRIAADLGSKRRRLTERKADREKVLAQAGSRQEQVEQKSASVEQKMQEINPSGPAGRPTGKVLSMVATAYSPEEPGLTDSTASGLKATRGIAAVDPSVIPLGTRLYVEGYGNALAADTGSAIKGMRIDLCFDTLAECNAYGRRTVKVEILD